MNIKRDLLVILALTFGLFLIVNGVAFAAVVPVPGPGGPTIQGGVNIALPGDTVLVAPGVYPEQVVINKNLNLWGAAPAPAVVVQPPNPITLNTLIPDTWFGGPVQIAPIIAVNAPLGNVNVQDIEVDGQFVNAAPPGASYVAGVCYAETSGIIGSIIAANMNVGNSGVRGYGAWVTARTFPSNVIVGGSNITNFAKNGINFLGSALTATAVANTITGGPYIALIQNGIVAIDGPNVTALGNTVSNITSGDPTYWSCGILYYGSNAAVPATGSADANTITDCQCGVMFQDTSGSATDNTISATLGAVYRQNGLYAISGIDLTDSTQTVTFSDNVVSDTALVAIGVGSYGGSGPNAELTATIDGNTLTNNEWDGIGIGVDYEPSVATNGKVFATATDNTITGILSGNDWGINIAEATVKQAAMSGNTLSNNSLGLQVDATTVVTSDIVFTPDNSVAGNTAGLINSASGLLGARFNWWGDSSGPTNPGNPGGTGDSVTGNVSFAPWIISTTSAPYNNATGTTVDVPGGHATVTVPPGNGSLGDITVNETTAPSGGELGAPTTTAFIMAEPSGTDFGTNKALWPTMTLAITSPSLAEYKPYYWDGTAWVPYASTDYCDLSNNEGRVSIISGTLRFKVKHFTPLGGGGTPPTTGANTYALLGIALLAIALGIGLLATTRKTAFRAAI